VAAVYKSRGWRLFSTEYSGVNRGLGTFCNSVHSVVHHPLLVQSFVSRVLHRSHGSFNERVAVAVRSKYEYVRMQTGDILSFTD
jgi:hypothetical protein